MPEILHLTQPIITSVATLNLSVHKLLQVVVHYVGVEDAATGTGRNSATHGVLFNFVHPFLNLHCNVTSTRM